MSNKYEAEKRKIPSYGQEMCFLFYLFIKEMLLFIKTLCMNNVSVVRDTENGERKNFPIAFLL